MKVFILGRHETLYQTAKKINLSKKHEIVGVLTADANKEHDIKSFDYDELSELIKCPFKKANRLSAELLEWIKELNADICISSGWVTIIGKEVTTLFRNGALNMHFGDLPRFRGNACTNWHIVLGELEGCLTIHEMEPDGLDSGKVFSKMKMPLSINTTIKDIIKFCTLNAPKMLLKTLDNIEMDRNCGLEQKLELKDPIRCYPRLRRDSKINWNISAQEIHALVRASTQPYNGAYTYFRDSKLGLRKLIVWESSLIANKTVDIGIPGHVIKNDKSNGASLIYCGEGIISLTKCQFEDEEEIFKPGIKWKSIRMRLGMDIEEEIQRLDNLMSKITPKLNE